ncbi:ribosomal protein S2 [Calocera viscosa TUFC12733]|uniref:Ribosomal protein S2 n=1 Tax=Calocera viscosa (strain TUFC12733) TaxID=1330018 RepID=A0A167L0K7_CALVF|nr:ribosomal protein S2 [Calocera viscosa TUFC12733]
MASILRHHASTSAIRPLRPSICSRSSLRSRGYVTATPTTHAGDESHHPQDGSLEDFPAEPDDSESPPPPPSSHSLPAEWARRVHERKRRRNLVAMFQDMGSTQTRETTFQAFHTLNRAVSPSELTISALMAAGAHMGHSRVRTRPAFLPYVYGRRANMDIIDMDQTLAMLRRAASFLTMLTEKGGSVLWVGTDVDGVKKAARKASERVGKYSYHIADRWIPGIFTNAGSLLGTEIMNGDYLPDAAVFLNPRPNLGALRECNVAMVPTIGIVDSDTDPRIVTYAIPANDESVRTVELIAGVLSVAAREGVRRADLEQARAEQMEGQMEQAAAAMERDSIV